MYLKHMRPAQIRDAVERDLPVILPIGCVECHGYHLPVGCDTIIVEEVARGEEMFEAMAAAWAEELGPISTD